MECGIGERVRVSVVSVFIFLKLCSLSRSYVCFVSSLISLVCLDAFFCFFSWVDRESGLAKRAF